MFGDTWSSTFRRIWRLSQSFLPSLNQKGCQLRRKNVRQILTVAITLKLFFSCYTKKKKLGCNYINGFRSRIVVFESSHLNRLPNSLVLSLNEKPHFPLLRYYNDIFVPRKRLEGKKLEKKSSIHLWLRPASYKIIGTQKMEKCRFKSRAIMAGIPHITFGENFPGGWKGASYTRT